MPQPLSPSEKPDPMPQKPHCAHCGDVIGAYEPMTLVLDGEPRRTSAFAEQARDLHSVECYHSACFSR
jgi:hypothetical protein